VTDIGSRHQHDGKGTCSVTNPGDIRTFAVVGAAMYNLHARILGIEGDTRFDVLHW
jgi:hypothetical protein